MFNRKKQLTNAELSVFCQQMAMVINAGLPTYYGVSILADEAPNEATRELFQKIYTPMEIGGTLHSALEDVGNFPPYMINMIELGEQTGRLEEVLNSLAVYYDREDTIRRSSRNAITYPFILSILMVVVIFVMVTKVLPVFSQIYEQLGSTLTGSAQTLMTISNFLNKYMLILVALFVILIIAGYLLYRTQLGKVLFQGRGIAMTIAASRFANCMYLALSSGLDTDKGLDLAELLVNNPHMQSRIDLCRENISHGETFASSLLHSNIFSKIYSSWIALGSKTGSMDEVMQHICEAYEEETDSRLNHFISILEPSLIIVLCFFMGLIIVSFLLPLLGIMTSIG